MYKELPRSDIAELICTLGNQVNFLVEGHIGSSKSALLEDISQALPDHHPVYFDMATIADAGDFQIPAVNHETQTSSFYPNASLGVHTDTPMIIMFDELGKSASQSIINAILPAFNDRRWGNRKFHPDTVVFGTTNLGREHVGDVLKPHVSNRLTRLRMAKPTADEYIAYMAGRGLDPILGAWIKRNPHCFQSFEELENPEDNPLVYHPDSRHSAFVTHRSMTRANDIMCMRDKLGEDAVVHALMGTVGAPAALDIQTFIRMADQLPSPTEIQDDPTGVVVPSDASAMIYLGCQAAKWVTRDTLSAWMTFMQRFEFAEAKAVFALMMANDIEKYKWASRNKTFTDFLRSHQHLF